MKVISSYKLTKGSGKAAGYDLRAVIDNPIVLKPFESVIIGTGVRIEIDEGMYLSVEGRSGMWFNHSILIGQSGTIDEDYTGEIKVKMLNVSKKDFIIQPLDRIAQFIICNYYDACFEYVDEIHTTERGSGGFGSSGIK